LRPPLSSDSRRKLQPLAKCLNSIGINARRRARWVRGMPSPRSWTPSGVESQLRRSRKLRRGKVVPALCAERQYRSRAYNGTIAANAFLDSGSRMKTASDFWSNACCSAASIKSSTGSSSALPQRGQEATSGASKMAPHCLQCLARRYVAIIDKQRQLMAIPETVECLLGSG
jgi:hypothetical protein